MGKTIANEYALTTFSILSGVASGVGAILLSSRLKKGKSADVSSLILASAISFSATLLAIYLIETSMEKPDI